MLIKKFLKLLPENLKHRLIRAKLDFGSGAPANIIFKIAETKKELEQAFEVLHDSYVDQGYMDPHPSGLRITKYHALPTTTVLIAKDIEKDMVIGTISIIRNTPLGLPLDAIFPLLHLKKEFNHLAEVSSLAIRKQYRKDGGALLWPLLRYFHHFIKTVMKIDAYVLE